MKFKIDRSVYMNLLNKVKKNLLNSNEEESLKYIIHELTDDGLKLTASNFKSRAEFKLPLGDYIQVEEKGIICIYGPKLIELVSAFSDGNLIISKVSKDNQDSIKLSLESKNKKKNAYYIPCIDYSIYPNNEFSLESNFKKVVINPQLFKYLIKNTEYASSKDDTRDISLMNIYLEVAEEKIFASGLSFEMMAYSICDKEETEGNGTFFLMNYAIKDFISLFDDVNEIEIKTDGKLLILQQTSFIYYLRMLNIEFPNWKTKTDMEFDFNVKINKENLIDTIKQIKIISPIVKLNINNNILTLNSVQTDILGDSLSSAEEQLDCEANGECTSILIIELLLDVLNKVLDKEVIISYNNDPKSPLRVMVDYKTNVLISTLKE